MKLLVDIAPLELLARWHDDKAGALDRCAYQALTSNWRDACYRRANFHRTSALYIRRMLDELQMWRDDLAVLKPSQPQPASTEQWHFSGVNHD